MPPKRRKKRSKPSKGGGDSAVSAESQQQKQLPRADDATSASPSSSPVPELQALRVLSISNGGDSWLQSKKWDDGCQSILESLGVLVSQYLPERKEVPPARIGTAFQRWRRKFPEHVQDSCGAHINCRMCTYTLDALESSSDDDEIENSDVTSDAMAEVGAISAAGDATTAAAAAAISPAAASASSTASPSTAKRRPKRRGPMTNAEAKNKVWCEKCAGVIQLLIGGNGTVWYCSKECMAVDLDKGQHFHFCNVAQAVAKLHQSTLALKERRKGRIQAQQAIKAEWHQIDPMLRASINQGRLKGAGLPAYVALGDLWLIVTQDVFGTCNSESCASVAHHFAVIFGAHNMNDFALEELRRAMEIEEEILGVDSKKALHSRLTLANTQATLHLFENAAAEFARVLKHRPIEKILDDETSIRDSRANMAMSELVIVWRIHRKLGLEVEPPEAFIPSPPTSNTAEGSQSRERDYAEGLINLCRRIALADRQGLIERPPKLDFGNALRYAKRAQIKSRSDLDVEYKDELGRTPLHMAAAHGHKDVCKFLVENCGAEINSRDRVNETPLMSAAMGNYWEVVQLFLDLGADPRLREIQGHTALDIARKHDCKESIAVLEKVKETRTI